MKTRRMQLRLTDEQAERYRRCADLYMGGNVTELMLRSTDAVTARMLAAAERAAGKMRPGAAPHVCTEMDNEATTRKD